MTLQLRFLVAAAMALCSLSAIANSSALGVGERVQPDGIARQQAGISTLQALDLLSVVAEEGIYDVDIETTLDYQLDLDLYLARLQLVDGGADAVTRRAPSADDPAAVRDTEGGI